MEEESLTVRQSPPSTYHLQTFRHKYLDPVMHEKLLRLTDVVLNEWFTPKSFCNQVSKVVKRTDFSVITRQTNW